MTSFKSLLPALFVIFAAALPVAFSAPSVGPPIITSVVDARFSDVIDGLTAAIGAHGGHIAHVVPAQQVLAASEAQYGEGAPRFAAAQTIEFCNARLAHALIHQSPNFLVLCPFGVSVYQLTAHPERVYLSYRNPRYAGGAEDTPVLNRVGDYLDAVVRDATQWFPHLDPE